MGKQRRNFGGPEKMAILRARLIEKIPVSELCDKHGIQPTMFCVASVGIGQWLRLG